MGLIGAAFGLGFVLGPVTGRALSQFRLGAPGLAAAALAAANGVAAFVASAGARGAERPAAARQGRFAAFFREMGLPGIRRAGRSSSSSPCSPSAPWRRPTPSWPASGTASTASTSASSSRYIGVIMVVVQGGLIGRLTRRYGEGRPALAGVLLQAVGAGGAPLRRERGRALGGHPADGRREPAWPSRRSRATLRAGPGRRAGRHPRPGPVRRARSGVSSGRRPGPGPSAGGRRRFRTWWAGC